MTTSGACLFCGTGSFANAERTVMPDSIHVYSHNHGHGHTHTHTHTNTKTVKNRLAKAAGQLKRVSDMVDREEDCADVLQQL